MKKIISIALAAVLCLSALSGCGEKKPVQTQMPSPTASATPEPMHTTTGWLADFDKSTIFGGIGFLVPSVWGGELTATDSYVLYPDGKKNPEKYMLVMRPVDIASFQKVEMSAEAMANMIFTAEDGWEPVLNGTFVEGGVTAVFYTMPQQPTTTGAFVIFGTHQVSIVARDSIKAGEDVSFSLGQAIAQLVASAQVFADEAVATPQTIFNTSASENGLENTIMSATGTVIKTEDVSGTTVTELKTEQGALFLTHELQQISVDDIAGLKDGADVAILMKYSGFSNVLNGPVGFLLCTEPAEDTLEPASTPTPTSTPTKTPEPSPTLDEQQGRTVYITKTGKKYHHESACNGALIVSPRSPMHSRKA